ncbi:hypothetical protein A5320_04700 [Rheinheimera sp. SA_1]|jgi:hypothetical protein|uniref:DUF3718 domain-containing protein n=1 Tax=Rheinheimera sp. SA_1 TaxID=1827365 RepID=UPI0007FD9B6E|nr:DUF3718 domain-containing protein [Rheinheimera sp. SA_1]OBP16690.1 hypothetical protein A5320_04700 [Rheinheimera sp. SA_1]
MNAKLIVLAAMIVGSGAVQANSEKHEFTPIVYEALVAVCTETSQDDRLSLYKTLKEYRIGVNTAVDKVVCNGLPLAAFARAEQAHKVSKFLAPYENRGKGHVDIKDIAPAN